MADARIPVDLRVTIEARAPGHDFTQIAEGIASIGIPVTVAPLDEHNSITLHGSTEGLGATLATILGAQKIQKP